MESIHEQEKGNWKESVVEKIDFIYQQQNILKVIHSQIEWFSPESKICIDYEIKVKNKGTYGM